MDNNQKLNKVKEIFSHTFDYNSFRYAAHANPKAVFVSSSYEWIAKALEIANAKKGDIFYDLGSGDGRALGVAKTVFNVDKAIGIEDNPILAELSMTNIARMKNEGINVQGMDVINKDYLEADFSDATVIYCFLDGYFNSNIERVEKKFQELKEGSRIVIPTVYFPWDCPENFKHTKEAFVSDFPTIMHKYVKLA